MKILGIILSIIGAICTIDGIVTANSWEYQLSSSLGINGSGVQSTQVILYGGVVVLIIGIVMLLSAFTKKN